MGKIKALTVKMETIIRTGKGRYEVSSVNHFNWPTNALNCIKLKG